MKNESIQVFAISSNDIEKYPQDAPGKDERTVSKVPIQLSLST